MCSHAVVQLAAFYVLLHNGGVSAAAPYVLTTNMRPGSSIFRIRMQQALTVEGNNAALRAAIDVHNNPNESIAIFLKMILAESFEARINRVLGIRLTFAIFVAEAQVVANFRRRQEVWIEPGSTGESVSAGLAHWPTHGHSCKLSRIRGPVNPREYPYGHPCHEGGAAALKSETWYGTVDKPKNVLAFYMLLPRLELVSRMDQADVNLVNNAVREKVSSCINQRRLHIQIPVDVTSIALCMRESRIGGSNGAVVAAAVAARAVGQDIEDNPHTVEDEDNNLCHSVMPGGSLFIDTRFIPVFDAQQQEIGKMKLLIAILPYIQPRP